MAIQEPPCLWIKKYEKERDRQSEIWWCGFLPCSSPHACWVQSPPLPRRVSPWIKTRNCLQIKNNNNNNSHHQKWIEIFMIQLFVQCVFYIAISPAAAAETNGIRDTYTKSAFNLQFRALFRKIDSRYGVRMENRLKEREIYEKTCRKNERNLVDFICMSCSTRTSFTQLTTAILIHFSLHWVVNRLCWADATVVAAHFSGNIHIR